MTVVFCDTGSGGSETEIFEVEEGRNVPRIGDTVEIFHGRVFNVESVRHIYNQSNVLAEIRIGLRSQKKAPLTFVPNDGV